MPLSSSRHLDSLLFLDEESQTYLKRTRNWVERQVDYDEEILRFTAATPECLASLLQSLDKLIVKHNLYISYRVQCRPDEVVDGRLDESFLEFWSNLLTMGSDPIVRNIVIAGSKRMIDMFNDHLEDLVFQEQQKGGAVSVMVVDRKRLPSSQDEGGVGSCLPTCPTIRCGINDYDFICGGDLDDQIYDDADSY